MAASELRQHLTTLDSDLAERAGTCWKSAGSIHARASKPDASDNGTNHCWHVELYIWRLLKETQRLAGFSATELFLLSCSACCHDLDRGLRSSVANGAEHGEGSGGFVVNHHMELGISQPEAIAVDCIVSVHDKKGAAYSDLLADVPEAYSLPTGPVDLQRLAVLLKAADTLHTDNTRISELGTDPAKLAGVDREKYLFRQCISGWRRDGNRIVISACPASHEHWQALLKGESFMKDKEWSSIAGALRRYGFPHRLEFDNDDHLLRRRATEAAPHDLPGMDYYHEGDAALLAGRDAEIRSLEDQVLGNPSSLLIGPSGVGKSSVIQAGLVPRLRQLAGWGIVVTRPDKVTGEFFTAADFRDVVDGPVAGSDGYAELCRLAMAKHSRLLVVLDQFEDIAYFGAFDIDAIATPVLDALGRHRHLKVLFSYRDDVESLMVPLWQAISHTAAGLPKYAMRRLGRNDAEASLRRLLGAKRIALEDDDAFMKMLLDELVLATEREAGMAGTVVYPPFIQMVVQQLSELATGGHVAVKQYQALTGDGGKATDRVIGEYLRRSVDDLENHGQSVEEGKRVLSVLAHSSGKKGAGNEDRIVAESQVSRANVRRLLDLMTKLRLVRPLGGGEWEIMHDLLAKHVMEEFVTEHERNLKQIREVLEARARTFRHHGGLLTGEEMKELWISRHQGRSPIGTHLQPVLLASMAELDQWSREQAQAASDLTEHHERIGPKIASPESWFAPGWAWLSNVAPDELITTAHNGVQSKQLSSYTAYVKIVALIGTAEDVDHLLRDCAADWGWFTELGQQATICVASLATKQQLPQLREHTKSRNPHVRAAAIYAIGKVGTEDDLTGLAQLSKDQAWQVKRAVASAIGDLRQQGGLGILEGMLSDVQSDKLLHVTHGDEVILAVVRAVGALGCVDGLRILDECPNRNGTFIQRAAAESYALLKSGGEISSIRSMISSANEHDSIGAARLLAKLGTRDDVEAIRKVVQDSKTDRVAEAAIRTLGFLGGTEDAELVRGKLAQNSAQWPLMEAMLGAIGRIGAHADINLVRPMLNDKVSMIRDAAFHAFCRLANHDDIPFLRELMSKGLPWCRWTGATRTLARLLPSAELCPQMGGQIREGNVGIGYLAAQAAVPTMESDQLLEFLAKHERDLAPPVLAVFDWCLYAPSYLKDGYERWRKRQNEMPPIGW